MAWRDFEFYRPANQGEQDRMDLLTDEVGHMLGYAHTRSGVMAETLADSTRRVPSLGSDWFNETVLDRVFADRTTGRAVPFLDGSLFGGY